MWFKYNQIYPTEKSMTELGFQSKLTLSYEATLQRVTDALKAEGFGVLTSIDVKDTIIGLTQDGKFDY